MSGRVCKAIINNATRALTDSLERILLDSDINQGRLPEDVHAELIQRLADIDLACYSGTVGLMPPGGLVGIVNALQEHGLVTDEVWEILHRPVSAPALNGPKPKKDKAKDRGNGEGL